MEPPQNLPGTMNYHMTRRAKKVTFFMDISFHESCKKDSKDLYNPIRDL
jgi:hypothetical protein